MKRNVDTIKLTFLYSDSLAIDYITKCPVDLLLFSICSSLPLLLSPVRIYNFEIRDQFLLLYVEKIVEERAFLPYHQRVKVLGFTCSHFLKTFFF